MCMYTYRCLCRCIYNLMRCNIRMATIVCNKMKYNVWTLLHLSAAISQQNGFGGNKLQMFNTAKEVQKLQSFDHRINFKTAYI